MYPVTHGKQYNTWIIVKIWLEMDSIKVYNFGTDDEELLHELFN
jgi:hypothetical protein